MCKVHVDFRHLTHELCDFGLSYFWLEMAMFHHFIIHSKAHIHIPFPRYRGFVYSRRNRNFILLKCWWLWQVEESLQLILCMISFIEHLYATFIIFILPSFLLPIILWLFILLRFSSMTHFLFIFTRFSFMRIILQDPYFMRFDLLIN